jgi:death on curing protein
MSCRRQERGARARRALDFSGRLDLGYYDTIIHEAAALLESLVQNHPFVDGNKRVAFAVADVFLRINGYSITADSKAIHHYILELFEERAFDMEHWVPWLQEIARPRVAAPR